MSAVPQGHSPLGASGAPRWMVCPGSVQLSYGLVDEESDHAAIGTAAHAVSAACLAGPFNDAWESIGTKIDSNGRFTPPEFKGYKDEPGFDKAPGIIIDKDMADAVQVYLDFVRNTFPDRNQGNTWVERRFHCPSLHKYFYGTTDLAHLQEAQRHLHVADYKHGAGIVVEVDDNEQLMYYACGMLEDLLLWDDVDDVTLYIVQPRGFHFDGPIRSWTITTEQLNKWLFGKLLPAMDKALVSRDTGSGEHCRFCPARAYACPQIVSDMTELEKMMTELDVANQAGKLTNPQISRFMELLDIAKIAGKAASNTAFSRLQAGEEVPGFKLAKAKSNREWKDGSEKEIKKALGTDAMTKPELISPAQAEKLPGGTALCARYAHKPDKGLTVVRTGDSRPEVSRDTKSMFVAATKTRKGKAA